MEISRRTLLAAGALTVGTVPFLAACTNSANSGSSTGASGPLVVNGYGGDTEKIWETAVREPFTNATGIEITYDSSGTASEDYARLLASKGNPGWDVAYVTAQEPVQGAESGLLSEINEGVVPNLSGVYPELREAIGSFGASHEVQYMSLMYNTDVFDTPPTSWDALFDPANAGHVLSFDMGNLYGVFTLIMAAKLNGGSETDLEAGWELLEQLKKNSITSITASGDAVTHMQSGELWLMPYSDSRADFYKSEGLPYDFTLPTEGSIAQASSLIIPSAAANIEGAQRYIDFWLSPEIQVAWAQAYRVGPGREDVADQLPDEFRQRHICSAEDMASLIQPDYNYIIDNRSDWSDRFQELPSA